MDEALQLKELDRFRHQELSAALNYYDSSLARIYLAEEPREEYNDRLLLYEPYQKNEGAFRRDFPIIQHALTIIHEKVHLLQQFSTTSGLLLLMYSLQQSARVAKIIQNHSFKLPLYCYVEKIVSEGKIDASNVQMVSRFFDYLSFLRSALWLNGDIPPSAVGLTDNLKSVASGQVKLLRYSVAPNIDAKYYPVAILPASRSMDLLLPTPLGARHLFEGFARSVEFEHLVWFNEQEGLRMINSWLFDNDELSYNAAIRVMDRFLA